MIHLRRLVSAPGQRPKISETWDKVIAACLEKKAEARPQNVQEVGHQLPPEADAVVAAGPAKVEKLHRRRSRRQ